MKPTTNNLISHEKLLSLLEYDKDTGIFTWKVDKVNVKKGYIAGNVNPYGYRIIVIDRQLFRAHRLAWFYINRVWPENSLDHINGDRSDNRIENLRDATHVQNSCNSILRSTNKSGYKGVSWSKSYKSWIAKVRFKGQYIHIGAFVNKEDAASAYKSYVEVLHGEFFAGDEKIKNSNCVDTVNNKIDVLLKCLPDAPFKDRLTEEIGKKDAEIERLTALVAMQSEALSDMHSGWKYIRHSHGDLYGVGWDRAQNKAENALSATSETVSAWQSKRDNEIRAKALEDAADYLDRNMLYCGSAPVLLMNMASELRAKGE